MLQSFWKFEPEQRITYEKKIVIQSIDNITVPMLQPLHMYYIDKNLYQCIQNLFTSIKARIANAITHTGIVSRAYVIPVRSWNVS